MVSASVSARVPPHVRPRASCHRRQPLIASAFCDRKRKISPRLSHAILKEREGAGPGGGHSIFGNRVISKSARVLVSAQCKGRPNALLFAPFVRRNFWQLLSSQLPFPLLTSTTFELMFLCSDALRGFFYFAQEIRVHIREDQVLFEVAAHIQITFCVGKRLTESCKMRAPNPVPRNSI